MKMHVKRHLAQREKRCLFSGLVKFEGFLVGGCGMEKRQSDGKNGVQKIP
jgi:hypothetical protein